MGAESSNRRGTWAARTAGAVALAGLLQSAPARAWEDNYTSPVNAGVFLGISFLPRLQFSYGVDVRVGPNPAVFVRVEARELERLIFTVGGAGKLPRQPYVGEVGISIATRSVSAGPIGGLHLGAGIGQLGVHLLTQGLLPVVGDRKNYDLSLVGGVLFPEAPGSLQLLLEPLFPRPRLGRRLRHDDGHTLPNLAPGQEVPFEIRMHAPELEQGLLAAHWEEATRTEGAAIASFERLARELQIVEAPAGLVMVASRAACDEARHASICSQVAGRLTGLTRLPEKLDAPARWAHAHDDALACLAREAFEDGVLEEGAGASLLQAASRHAADPGIRDGLAAIASDEERHTSLAWATLEWLWRSDSVAARDAIVRAAEEISLHVAHPTRHGDEEFLARHGVLPAVAENELVLRHREGAARRVRRLIGS